MTDSLNFGDLRTITISLFVLTVLATSYRCVSRYTKKLWWHDDSVALFSALSFVIFLIGSVYLSDESPSPGARTTGTYIVAVGFYTPIWGARVSILLTVVRITPWNLQRKMLLWVVVFFVLQFAMLITQMFWVCELTYTGWKQIPGSICLVPPVVPISLVITTVVSDLILLLSPFMISRGVSVPALRFRLFFIFSMSIATTLSSVVHAVLVMTKPGVLEVIFGGVEAAVSIIVCNTTVIIPAVLRALGVGDPFMREDTVDPRYSIGLEIARTTFTGTELSLPISWGTGATNTTELEGANVTVVSRQQQSIDLNVREDRKFRLATQISGVPLGDLKLTSIVLPIDKSDTANSLYSPVSPVVKKDQDIEADAGRC